MCEGGVSIPDPSKRMIMYIRVEVPIFGIEERGARSGDQNQDQKLMSM
jgi:hypothetical protein